MSDPIRVVLLADDPDRRTRDATALSSRDGVVVTGTASPDDLPEAIDDADCIVTDDPSPGLPEDPPPVVAFADVEPSVAARGTVDGYVRRDGNGYDGLVDHIAFLAERGSGDEPAVRNEGSTGEGDDGSPGRKDEGSPGEKINRLHRGTADIVASRSMDDLYERTVAVAEEILAFDVCYLLVREGDRFVPRASSSVPTETGLESVPLDYGLTGHTYESGEAALVGDFDADPYADPVHGDYASGFSVPVGDWGVFQATAKEHHAFDEADVELAELLLSYANETRQRIAMEDRLRDRRETIERLHGSTADIVGCRTESELAEKTVAAAEHVLEFEACVVLFEADDADGGEPIDDRDRDPAATSDDYVIVASSGTDLTPPVGSRHDASSGVLGETVRTGETQLVDDVRDHGTAAPHDESYRSAISVPIGDFGVFQAISQSPGTYDALDRRLAELLVAHVTEALSRVRLEGMLRDREDELVEERDRLAALFENVPDAVAEFEFEDGEPVVRDVNEPFERIFGYDAGEIVGEPIDDYLVPEDHETEARELTRKLAKGERLTRAVRRRTRGGLRDFLLHVVPLEVGERNVQGFAIYTDVTDQKRRERRLERQNERLDQFASIVSHDLRNPLTVAQGNLDLARSEGECDHDALDRVARAHDRMNRMIDELLSLARHGDVVGDRVSVELREAADAAWASAHTESADLQVADDAVLPADRDRFVELLENLFRNAVEHAGPDVEVTVGTWTDGIYVADDGPGVPEDERDRVFESGFTTASDGTGFGLSIVERIAEAHGWSVSLTESEAGGARFEFAIPDVDEPSVDLQD